MKTEEIRDAILFAVKDESLIKLRFQVARFAAESFTHSGKELNVFGQILGPDRKAGVSPFGHGSDESVAVSTLLRIAGQLIAAAADLFEDSRPYAAAALVRQLVEIEYLAWAIETKDGEGARWLRSDKAERESFFTPAKLRKAADGKFRGQDYGYHCELGGHPVPGANALLNGNTEIPQILLSDMLGHAGRIWDHMVLWAHDKLQGGSILSRAPQMSEKFGAWKSLDVLIKLPPPP